MHPLAVEARLFDVAFAVIGCELRGGDAGEQIDGRVEYLARMLAVARTAKELGRNNIQFFRPDMKEEILNKIQMAIGAGAFPEPTRRFERNPSLEYG